MEARRDIFRLGIITKLWGRPRTAAFVMRHFARMQAPGVELVCVGARSPGDSDPAPDVEGWEYVEAPNRPLSDKGNYAARALKGRVDAILNVGSDDVVGTGFVLDAVDRVRGGCDLVIPDTLYFFDLATQKAMSVRSPRIGAGRVLSARLLNRLDWRPWPSVGELPDRDMDEYLASLQPISTHRVTGTHLKSGRVVLDIKDGQNLDSYRNIERRRTPQGRVLPVSPRAVWAALGIPDGEVDALVEAHLEAAS